MELQAESILPIELNLSTAMNNLVSEVSALILTVHANDLVIILIDFNDLLTTLLAYQ